MTFLIQKDEPSNASRRIPCRVFTSNGTAADTGAVGDAVILWLPSGATISASSGLTAIHAAQGMYYQQLTQSEVSLLGPHMIYHTVGDFPQHLANFEVVNSNPLSEQSNILVDSIAAGSYSGVTIQGLSNYANISNVTLHAGTHSNATIQGISNYANISNVTLHAGTHSNVTIQGVTRVNSGVTLNADTHSGATIQGISNYANISNVTLHAGTHSAATVQGVSNYANFPLSSVATSVWSGKRSDFTTPGSFGEYVYSQVTGISSGTVFGVTDTSNFPGGSSSASSPEQIADYVWASYLTRTLTSTSTATLLRVVEVTSGVTLKANTHSGATIQGVTRVNSSVTPADAEYSAITVRIGLVDYSGATLGAGNIAPAVYSGVSVEVKSGGIQAGSLGAGTITAAKFGAGAIDAAALATDAGQEIADRVLSRNIETGSDSGRLVRHALAPLRNRILIEGSVGTVYQADDSTSLWTFSPSLGTAPIAGVDPTG